MALCVCLHVYAEVITVLFDCLLYQLYLISSTPVVPAAVDRFDIEVLSSVNTSSVVITYSVSTPQACKFVLLQNIVCMSLSSLV